MSTIASPPRRASGRSLGSLRQGTSTWSVRSFWSMRLSDEQGLGRSVGRGAAFGAHAVHHAGQAFVAGDAAAEDDVLLADVGQGPLGDLGQHGEHGLLHAVGDVLLPVVVEQSLGGGQDAGEGHVHAFDRVRQLEQLVAAGGQAFDLGAAGERLAHAAGQLVEEVADADVQGLAEDAVAAAGVGDDLGVGAGGVQQQGVVDVADGASDLEVGHAVVDADEGQLLAQRQGAGDGGTGAQAGAQPGALGERDRVDRVETRVGLPEGAGEHVAGQACVVVGGLAGVDAAGRAPRLVFGGRRVQLALVGEHLGVGFLGRWVTLDDADAERVSRRFDAEDPHRVFAAGHPFKLFRTGPRGVGRDHAVARSRQALAGSSS
jgi:hypothetical protein